VLEGYYVGMGMDKPAFDTFPNLLLMDPRDGATSSVRLSIPYKEIDSVWATLTLHKDQVLKGWSLVRVPVGSILKIHTRDGKLTYAKVLKTEKRESATDLNTINVKNMTDDKLENIPTSNIDFVEFQGSAKTYWAEGLAIGLVLDAIVVIRTGINLSADNVASTAQTIHTVSENDASCPFVYSHDGNGYQLDGELFVGAFYQGIQRTDICKLEHLQPVKGQYKIRLANDMQEAQYIDYVSLLAVDHPVGARVYPCESGSLYAVGQAAAPSKALDLSGKDISDRLKAADNRWWLSSPFGRNPDNPADLRDGAVIEFVRPQHADTAVLALRVMNTAWAINTQASMLKLPGRDQEKWYAAIDESEASRNMVAAAMIREFSLQVSVWNGKNWMPQGAIREVGVAAARDVALAIPLRGLPAEGPLKIQLTCTPGAWEIDFASVDFHALQVWGRPLPVSLAFDHRDYDIVIPLRDIDGQYFIMKESGQYADLIFDAPTVAINMERTVLVKCNGYYRENTPALGEPQIEQLNQLMMEPNAYSHYALQMINQQTKKAIKEVNK
jgi:hypothetical protein